MAKQRAEQKVVLWAAWSVHLREQWWAAAKAAQLAARKTLRRAVESVGQTEPLRAVHWGL